MSDHLTDQRSEQAAIGAVLLDAREALPLVLAEVSPDQFADHRHVTILQAAATMDAKGEPVTLPGLCAAGISPVYLAELSGTVPTVQSAGYHARLVLAAWQRRELAGLAERAVIAAKGGEDPGESCAALASGMDRLQAGRQAWLPIRDVVSTAMARLESGEALPYTPTGIRTLDEFLPRGGLPGGLITTATASSTGGGKTALGLTLAWGAAERGYPVAICSLEDSALSMIFRGLANRGQVDGRLILRGQLEARHWDRLTAAAAGLANLPVVLMDEMPASAEELCAAICLDIRRRGTRLVIIDYLQLLQAGRGFRGGPREAVNYVLSVLVRLVRRSPETAFVVVSQLSRDKERERKARAPMLGDLKESGNIENESKLVLMLYRPVPVDDPDHPDLLLLKRHCQLLVRKNTEGDLGRICLGWQAERQTYRDLSRGDELDYRAAVKRLVGNTGSTK